MSQPRFSPQCRITSRNRPATYAIGYAIGYAIDRLHTPAPTSWDLVVLSYQY